MAQKRMFDKRITDSDKFTDLPNSSKALYFMAGMSADDRGFFQPRRLQKMNGFTDDDFKVLIAKRYFIPFESGVMVITDWNKNNYLDKNRINETEYIDELKMLKLINEKYELNDTGLTSVKPPFNQYSIEENSIEENISFLSSETQLKEDAFSVLEYMNTLGKRQFKPVEATMRLIKARLKEHSVDELKDVVYNRYQEWCIRPFRFTNGQMSDLYYRPSTLFNATNFQNYLEEYRVIVEKEENETH